MYQQYLILHIDLQLTIYPKLSVIFNTLSSNEFFMFKTLKDWMFTNTNYYKKIMQANPQNSKWDILNLAMFRDVLRKESWYFLQL